MNIQHIGTHNARKKRCERIAERVCRELFRPLRGRNPQQLTLDDVLYIINEISNHQSAPAAPMKNWGDCIAAIFSMQHLLETMGTNGSNLQLQCKHAITCSVLVSGDNNALVLGNTLANKQFLEKLLPHLSRKVEIWIRDCRALRDKFYNGQSKNVCKEYKDLHRDSLALISNDIYVR